VTISSYSLGHRLVKEIAEEVRSKKTYDLDNPSLDSLNLLLQYKLGTSWVLRFIIRYPHLQVVIGRRVESVRIDGATKLVLSIWFDAYKKLVQDLQIT
jgi:hypothetical protein